MNTPSETRPPISSKLDGESVTQPTRPTQEQSAQHGAARRSSIRQIDCSGRDTARATSRTSGTKPPRGRGPNTPRGGHAA